MTTDSRCQVHRGKPASFRCRSCRRPFCDECRAVGAADLCGKCDLVGSLRESVEEKVDIRSTGIAKRRKSATALWSVLALVALNLVGGVLLLRNRALLSPIVQEAFNDIEVVSRAVEASRDASNRVPATLDKIRPPLPSAIESRVRRGEIRYQPSDDLSTFTVEAVLYNERQP